MFAKLVSASFLIIFSYSFLSSQEPTNGKPDFEVDIIYPGFSITKEALINAESLLDLNPNYKPSWVKEYLSVEIQVNVEGKNAFAYSKNDQLSLDQKELLKAADVDEEIEVRVQYIPENNLKNNEPKEIDFKLSRIPDHEAGFPGGEQKLEEYLKVNAIDKIKDGIYVDFDITAIKFIIDEYGKVTNAHIFWSSDDSELDQILLETINKMPDWNPAEYANGIKTKQHLALAVGNLESCVINLINFHQD